MSGSKEEEILERKGSKKSRKNEKGKKIGVERINGVKRRGAKERKKRETTEDTKRKGEGGRRIVHVLTQLCPCLDNLLPAPCQAG